MKDIRTVLIPSAGTGSSLGEYTSKYNKAMTTVGPKPVISYVIEKFTKDDTIIICTGYKADYLKQVIKVCYPDWHITFVDVDKYEGPGSGPGYSIIKARTYIQGPFYFFCNDTIIDEDIRSLPTDSNFIIGADYHGIQNPENYRNLLVNDGIVSKVLPKGDPTPNTYPYIGAAYIKDWKDFFAAYDDNPELFINAGEAVGLNNLKNSKLVMTTTGIDTGNKKILEKAKVDAAAKMEATILEKPDESLWFFDDKVVKFHVDENFIKGRIERSKTILSQKNRNGLFTIPEIIDVQKNVYSYKFALGHTVSSQITPVLFDWLITQYFTQLDYEELDKDKAKEAYHDFYYDKTLKRINDYLVKFEDLDNHCEINGLSCQPVKYLVEHIDFDSLSKKAIWSKNFHGDFHLENILYDGEKFTLLDWRQNFGKLGNIGDIYYDLGKLWHSFYISDKMIKDGFYTIKEIGEDKYIVDIHRTLIDTDCENLLIHYLDNSMYDVNQAKLMMILVIVNIAALHVYPYSKFAFYLGKYLLNEFYNAHPEYFIK